MQTKLLAENGGQQTFAIVLETGDELMACLKDFAKREELMAAQFSAIGAFSNAVMTYFDWETKQYLSNPVKGQVEVVSLTGDVALAPDSSQAIHIRMFGFDRMLMARLGTPQDWRSSAS